jgi:hypothetical protein
MKYAVLAPVGANVTADPQWMAEFAVHVEACGFESIVVVEHPVVIADYQSRYPYDSSGRFDLAEDCDIPATMSAGSPRAARRTSPTWVRTGSCCPRRRPGISTGRRTSCRPAPSGSTSLPPSAGQAMTDGGVAPARVAVVTGGGAGIGAATCRRLARGG